MNYNKFDAAPFCPHFFNCKKLHDKEHKKKYMHPCVKGKSCDQLNSKYHTRFWYHFDLPTCPHGSACQQICDPKHRSEFHHEAKKGEHAIRDYMLNCDHCENCIIEDRVHAMTFQHIRPFVFPQDGIVPEFVPDHKDKMCKVCHNKERECSCVHIPQSPRPHSPEAFVTAPPMLQKNQYVESNPSESKSKSVPSNQVSQSTLFGMAFTKSRSVPLSSRPAEFRLRWKYNFEAIPQMSYQFGRKLGKQEMSLFDVDNCLTWS